MYRKYKNKIVISSKMLYRMYLKHVVKKKIDEPMVTFPKNPSAVRQVFISTGILKQEKKVHE